MSCRIVKHTVTLGRLKELTLQHPKMLNLEETVTGDLIMANAGPSSSQQLAASLPQIQDVYFSEKVDQML